MAQQGYPAQPSVGQDYQFPKHPEGYSFTQAGDGQPMMVQQQQYPQQQYPQQQYPQAVYTAHSGGAVVQPGGVVFVSPHANRYVYPRNKETRCRDLRSQAISCIVYGVLWFVTGVAFVVTFSNLVGSTGGQSSSGQFMLTGISGTTSAGIWGGIVAIIGGSLALLAANKADQITPNSQTVMFAGLLVSQLIALTITTAAVVVFIPFFQIFLNALIIMASSASTYDSNAAVGIATEPTVWLALFCWIFSLGPVGSLVYTFKHILTVMIDVITLKP
ncbi:hypothetical protein BV898_06202 [Hypsibius exemplaris]|uniref:Uncharacterized protein n=1 Tax=Hypsibius exemplaris TaxID=2072580 RepID=A0A1W0WXL3_HYPEX|nr:hypothetical protein BV898_06202 [Hypsibius exemplaris]